MENNQIIAAPIKNRFFAFIIDIFFVYLLRVLYINFSLYFWLKKPIISFLSKYKLLYGEINLSKVTSIEVAYFVNSNLFTSFILFMIGIFLIAILYNFLFFCSKWSATIGQKIMGIYVVSKNDEKMKLYHSLARSIVLVLPWVFMFIILFYNFLVNYNLVQPLGRTSLIMSILIFVSWYDMIFLTKNKLVFHDYITLSRVIIKNPEKYMKNQGYNIWSFLFPDFKSMYSNLKDNVKQQIQKVKEIKEKYKEENKNKD